MAKTTRPSFRVRLVSLKELVASSERLCRHLDHLIQLFYVATKSRQHHILCECASCSVNAASTGDPEGRPVKANVPTPLSTTQPLLPHIKE